MLFGIIEDHEKLAIINDPDGYTNLRKEKSPDSEIISMVFSNQVFYYRPNAEESWWKVTVYQFIEDNIEGYMHKSRILPIDQLSVEAKKNLILYIFNKEITNYENYLEKQISGREFEEFHDTQLVPILSDFFPNYICTYKDTTVVLRFFDIINLETGSADESPAWALGDLYLCEPNFTIKMINKRYTDLLLGDLEFGFLNVTFKKENEIEDFEQLKFKLDSLMNSKRNEN